MKFIKPLVLDDDSFDYNLYVIAGDNDTPLNRVLVACLMLLVNLIIGCFITVIFFKVRGYVLKLLNLLFFDICKDCDCDYDGTYPSRSESLKYRRIRQSKRKSKKVEAKEKTDYEQMVEDDTFIEIDCQEGLNSVWEFCAHSLSIFGGKGKQFLFYLFGVCSCYMIMSHFNADLSLGPSTYVHSFSHPSVLLDDPEDSPRVYLITPSVKSGIQPARLLRIAQALYPVRHYVTWIIVSADPVRSYHWSGIPTEHWKHGQIALWKRNQTKIMEHMEDVKGQIDRFGIPYVILSGHEIHHKDKNFKMLRHDEKSIVTARQIGLAWFVKTYSKGVLFLGNENAVYKSALFSEVRKTKQVSAWPLYAQSSYLMGLSSPVFSEEKGVLGYFRGGRHQQGVMLMQVGAYAINCSIAKKLYKSNELWKLSMDNNYRLSDLGLRLEDVQCIGNNCSTITAWHLSHSFSHVYMVFNKDIPIKPLWKNSNVKRLIDHIQTWFAFDMAV